MNQPLILIGYRRPNAASADDLVFDVLSLLLGRGKTGLLEKDLVQTKKVALATPNVPTFPAGDYPNTFAILLATAPGSTVEENEKALADVIEDLRTKPIDTATLERIRIRARSGLIRRIETNSGLAGLLPLFHEQYGTWERLFTALDDLDKVSPADIMRVASQYFVDKNKVVAVLGPEPKEGAR
jgi:zinc protease